MLWIRRWRDAALAYKQDPKNVSNEDRARFTMFMGGDEEALTKDLGFKKKPGKVGELKAMMDELRSPKKKKAKVKNGSRS